MEKITVTKIIVFAIFIVIGLVILIFNLRKNYKEIDYDKYIKLMKEQTKNNLNILNNGNKEINKIEKEIGNIRKKINRSKRERI